MPWAAAFLIYFLPVCGFCLAFYRCPTSSADKRCRLYPQVGPRAALHTTTGTGKPFPSSRPSFCTLLFPPPTGLSATHSAKVSQAWRNHLLFRPPPVDSLCSFRTAIPTSCSPSVLPFSLSSPTIAATRGMFYPLAAKWERVEPQRQLRGR